MTKNHSERPLAAVRRKDRAIENDGWIVTLLERAPMAQLATADTGQPFINSNLFVYDQRKHVIYMHTAAHGRTRSNVDACDRVCVSVSEMGRLLPSPIAFTMSVEYAGVVIFGRGRALDDGDEKVAGLRMIVEKYFGHLRWGIDYREASENELTRTSVYRIDIDEWSGKQKQVEPEYPGAFRWPERFALRASRAAAEE